MPTEQRARSRAYRTLAFILAGGKGERLHPLTSQRAKPSVPFGGKYRIIDFALSNFVNSGIHSMYILVQYLSQSLIEHLRSSWRGGGLVRDNFITVVPPQMRRGPMWYRGTADAVRQNLNLIRDHDPDVVAVFGGDHIYRMDVSAMIDAHYRTDADATVAAIPVPIQEASSFGIVETAKDGRITGFTEKPPHPKHIPGNPRAAYVSMGNYIFKPSALISILESPAWEGAEIDFGRTIFPSIIGSHKVYAYDFADNILPGLKDFEEKSYWRDVGTLKSYYDANMDLLGTKPAMDLANPKWPIRTGGYDGPQAKILDARLENSIVGSGCLLEGAHVKNSILGRGISVEKGAIIENSIIMGFTRIGAGSRIKNAVIDRFNSIEAKTEIGVDVARDAERYFRDASGIVVVPRGREA